MVDLGTLGGSESQAYAINDAGVIAGSANPVYPPNNWHVVRWLPDFSIEDLGTLDANLGAGRDINRSGHIAGWSNSQYGTHAILWSQAEGMVDLEGANPPPFEYPILNRAWGLNDRDQVVGWGYTESGKQIAFRWAGGVTTVLPDLDGAYTWATDVNNQGVTVGSATGAGTYHPVRWTASGSLEILPTLGGEYLYPNGAWAINEVGDIAGASRTAEGQSHAALWTDQGVIDLQGLLPGSAQMSAAHGINDRRQVVGWSSVYLGGVYSQHAFLWTASGGTVDLGALCDPCYSVAMGINNRGQVVGYSETAPGNRQAHATLWTIKGMQ